MKLNFVLCCRIAYVHLMAHFKMRTQIAQQTRAFLLGFQTIVRREWLDMFSASELQKLISGDTVDIDLDDLRCVTSGHLCAVPQTLESLSVFSLLQQKAHSVLRRLPRQSQGRALVVGNSQEGLFRRRTRFLPQGSCIGRAMISSLTVVWLNHGFLFQFVTSCSKPPLLGFEYLEPPFSIRCVEVSDDEVQLHFET